MNDPNIIDSIIKESQMEINESKKVKFNIDDLLKEYDSTPLINENGLSSNKLYFSASSLLSNTPSANSNGSVPKSKKDLDNKKEILNLPDFPNQLDYINFFEMEITNQNKINPTFNIDNYKEQLNKKINFLEIEPLDDLSKKIFNKNNIDYTSMCVKDNIIALGDSKGEITLFSLNKRKEIKKLSCPESIDVNVTCIDIIDDLDFILAGFSNGMIVLFDIEAEKSKYTIKNLHQSTIINLKFYKREKKNFWFFSSESDGKVCTAMIKDWVFKYTVAEVRDLVVQNRIPTFLIKIINFPKLINDNNLSKGVIFGTLNNIRIYTIEENDFKYILTFKKPDSIKDNALPDASCGLGIPPSAMGLKPQDIKNEILLLIAWGNFAYLKVLNVDSGVISQSNDLAYYVNISPILRAGFLSESLIYIFDSQKFIKVVNSQKFTNKMTPDIQNEVSQLSDKTELDEGRLVEPEVKFQSFEDVNKRKIEFYLNFIIENNKKIHLLGKKTFYNGNLLNWETCLDDLQKNGDWDDLLKIGIEIFYSRMPALADIPKDEKKRKMIVGKYLRKSILQYVLFNLCNKRGAIPLNDHIKENEIEINKCIETAIEFCIEIEAVDYLFTNLQLMFDSKDCIAQFLSKLEPFIMCNKISTIPLNEDVIRNIIDIYKRHKKHETLSHLLVHLNINSIDNEIVRKECQDPALINPYIYLCMYGKEENYFDPIAKMFNLYLKAMAIRPFNGYKEEYEKHQDLIKIKKSQQYLGHKLLWYIKWCLTEKKFPDKKTIMNPTHFKELIPKITYWLLTPKVFAELTRIDPKNYFAILQQIFSSPKLYDYIIEESQVNKNKQDSILAELNISDLKPETLIESFITQSNLVSNDKIELNLQIFVAKASHLTSLSKEQSIKTAKYIIENYTRIIGEKNFKDDEIYEISNDLIMLFQERSKFDDSNLREIFILLFEPNKNPFDITKIFFCIILKEYRKCLETYLEPNVKIKDKIEKFFKWVDVALSELKERDITKFNTLKSDILSKVVQIGNLSINEFYLLVNKWFQWEKRNILKKLEEDPKLELSFIEIILIDFNQRVIEGNEKEREDDFKGYTESLLKTHIKLLCQLDRKDEVLPNLHNNPFYPIEDCLQLCVQYKVSDAAIYLYKLTGDSEKELNLSLQEFQESFKGICKVLSNKETLDSKQYIKSRENFNKYLQLNIDVCEHNKDNNEDIWFTLLDKLYYFSKTLNNATYKNHIYEYKEIEGIINQDIKDLLEKMCSYVGVRKIIDVVTMKNENAEFKDFKHILIKVINTHSNIKKILLCTKDLLYNSVNIIEEEFIRLQTRGNDFHIGVCSECKMLFHKKKTIALFPCSHILHEECTDLENDEIVCRTCRKNEIEGMNELKSKLLSKKVNIDENRNSIMKNINSDYEDEAKMKKMKAFDQKNYEKRRVFIEKNGVNL